MIESLRRLWPYIRPFRRNIVWMFIFGFAMALVGGLVPLLLQAFLEILDGKTLSFIDRLPNWLVDSSSMSPEAKRSIADTTARWLPFGFPLLYLIFGALRYIHYAILNYTAERIIAGIRLDLIRKITRLNLTYHGSLERGSGGLISRVFNDTNLLQQGLNFYVDMIREPIQAMIYLSYMLWLDWKLTLGALLFLPFFLIMTKQIGRSLRKYGHMGRESMEDLTATLKETVDGVRVVQSFNLEGEMERRFKHYLTGYIQTARKIVMREQAVSPINEFLISFLIAGFAMYAIKEVLFGGAQAAEFVTFIIAAGLLQAPIKKLQDVGVKIQQSVVVTDRVCSILESKSEVPRAVTPKPFPRDWKTITFKNVSFAYAGELTLKNVNLTVKRGEVIALVGESGSGKSTLVNLLERFYDPTAGEIFVDDVRLNDIDLKELRHNVALVTQDVFLFRDTIARNIQAGDFSKFTSNHESSSSSNQSDESIFAEVERAAKLANAHSFISATPKGYLSPVGERGGFLSGGEKQRVSIARAIYKDAPILILDEATSALDSVSEMEVQKGLQHLMEGRTAFVIAHRLSTVFNANRILVMKKGEIIEEGTHQELLARGGEYNNFFQLQVNQGAHVLQK